jgi:hypothetical protein
MLIDELKTKIRSGCLSTQQELNLRRTALSAVKSARRKHKCEMLEPNERLRQKIKDYFSQPSDPIGREAKSDRRFTL